MGSRTLHPVTTAEAYLELLADRGIDVFLGNAGTDFASLVEAFARAEAEGGRAPRPLVIPHEFVAVSMAHGYYAAGGRPAAVMVHVNVGTGNASTAIITAARANVPILMSAGRTPVTEEGLPGSRDLHIHWAQESFDQAAMLREYVKWDYELRTPTQLEAVVDRALEVMQAEPRGPVYLTLPREVLAASAGRGDHHLAGAAPGAQRALPGSGPHRRGGADPGARRVSDRPRLGGRASIRARSTGLVTLAEAGGIGVVEADPIYLNFPHRHDLHLGYNASGTTNPSLAEADAVLVVEADVPWYPASRRSRRPARRSSTWASIPSSRATRCAAIRATCRSPPRPPWPCRSWPRPCAVTPIPRPWPVARERLTAEHRARHAAWEKLALEQASASTIGFAWAARCLGEIVDDGTVVVNEYPLDRRFAAFTRPGSYFGSPHSSGLGFGLGAALGVKLARPESTVIATVGDGAYFFGEPLSCLFVQRAHRRARPHRDLQQPAVGGGEVGDAGRASRPARPGRAAASR